MFRAGQQIGIYTLINPIGRGGFGEVWLAERRAKFVTTKVAVKLPLDEQVDHEAIKQEATLWEQASGHPNILPIIDADEYDGQVVIVSEYASDGSLEEWLKRKGKMPVEKTVEMMIQILDGLEFLHSRKIIHRDLKPANILLQGNTPRLADFGISRVMKTSLHATKAMGTPYYMSPEAFKRERTVQTDIWSIGVMMYEILKGERPFLGHDIPEIIHAVTKEEPKSLPNHVPLNLQKIILKALAKEPAKRYQTAHEMREDLRRIKETEAVVRPAPLPKIRTNRLYLLMWGGVGFISGLLSTFILGFRTSRFFEGPEKGLNLDLALFLSPGIVFGTAIYLFGVYFNSRFIEKRKQVFSYLVLTVASTLGWYLAHKIGENFGKNLFVGFTLAGMVGGTIIVSAELLLWHFTLQKWVYSVYVVLIASLSGLMAAGFLLRGNPWLLFGGWQALVLIAHAIAFINNKKLLIISSAVLGLTLAMGFSIFIIYDNSSPTMNQSSPAIENNNRAAAPSPSMSPVSTPRNSQETANVLSTPESSPSAPTALYKPPTRTLIADYKTIKNKSYDYVRFNIPQSSFRSIVIGKYVALIDYTNIIIISADQMPVFKNHGSYTYYYKSIKKSDDINVSLPAGDYFLIFDNRPWDAEKMIYISLELRYE